MERKACVRAARILLRRRGQGCVALPFREAVSRFTIHADGHALRLAVQRTRQQAIRAHGKLARRAQRVRCHAQSKARRNRQCFARESAAWLSIDYDPGHDAHLLASPAVVVETDAVLRPPENAIAPYQPSIEERVKDAVVMSSR